jgi:hypothetical protein
MDRGYLVVSIFLFLVAIFDVLWYNIMYFILQYFIIEGVCYDSYIVSDLFPLR